MDIEPLPVPQYKALSEKNSDGVFTACPYCRRDVLKTHCKARSIFNFKIEVCRRCAGAEKMLPSFDWTETLTETEIEQLEEFVKIGFIPSLFIDKYYPVLEESVA